ncbi:MAG TPA: hypothetical protein VNM41_09120, partial [Solirubrobacterales bacterium]|nr:hypothetical protein [Solirubrobacterales bacterium]
MPLAVDVVEDEQHPGSPPAGDDVEHRPGVGSPDVTPQDRQVQVVDGGAAVATPQADQGRQDGLSRCAM